MKIARIDCIVVIIFCLILFGLQLGNRPFATPDEGRYVEIAREMAQSNDFVTPRLNGVKYFEKPPLLYWLQSFSYKLFGGTESGMRLWIVLFATMGCLATYLFASSMFNRNTGLLSAFVLASSVLYFCLSRLIILDMAVSVLLTMSLFSFYKGFYEQNLKSRRLWFYLFSVFCALGVLTKGIMVLAVTGAIIMLWLTISRQWHKFKNVYFFSSFAIFLSLSLPWHIMAAIKNPGFLHKYFIVEHFLRYTTDIHARYKPFWFFAPIALAGLLPWGFCLPAAIRGLKDKNLHKFLIIWISFVFSFFSISNSKLIPYILPIFPPIAILIAHYLTSVNVKNLKLWKNFYSALSIFMGLTALIIYPYFADIVSDPKIIVYIKYLSVLFIISGLIVLFLQSKKQIITTLGATALLINFTIIQASPLIQKPSVKDFAEIILLKQKPGEKVVCLSYYMQDLPVYTKQQVWVVDYKGELEFGTTVEPTPWMTNMQTFLNMWQEKMWIMARKCDFDYFQSKNSNLKINVIKSNQDYVLFNNF